MTDTVLVTGGSGYIAGFLIRELVRQGWLVHATIRNLSREKSLRKLLAVDDDRLKCFQVDLAEDEGWASAMAGCTHVAHLASPFPARAAKTPDDLIVPARDGALRALRAAKAAGVRRFVMTSSVAAIGYGRPRGVYTLTEANWSIVDGPGIGPYAMSKTIAERAARDWVAAEGGNVEFCTINPSLVLGPVWSRDFAASIEVVKKLLDGALPGCPDLHFGLVDVRDLADLHVRALNAPGMAGERFIASGRTFSMLEVAKTLRERLGDEARRVPTRKLPDFLVRLAALFDPTVKSAVPELGSVRNWDARHVKEALDWTTRPPEESIIDTARSLIDLGLVKR